MAARTTNGGRLEHYEVRPSAGLGRINWPTGFSGTGWALLDAPGGTVVSRHAFRLDALTALIAHDGLTGVTADDLAGDTADGAVV